MATTSFFLLAHQDDEIGVLAEIERVLSAGDRPVCAYLTNGATRRVMASRRNAESMAVLSKLGVARGDIHFLGERASIDDGALIAHLELAYESLQDLAARIAPIGRLVFHAWEGGHQDHDAVHVLGVVLADGLGLLSVSRQFPLYRAPLGGPLPYTMLRSLPANGATEATRIPVRARIRYLGHCLSYRSQAKTFLGLLPFIVADYVLSGRQLLQPVSLARLQEPPHQGILLYEQWGRLTWAEFHTAAQAFLARHPPLPPASFGA